MTQFDTVIVVDWSARSAPSPRRESADAIWLGVARGAGAVQAQYMRTRAAAMAHLTDLLASEHGKGRRVLVGFDFPFAYPRGFARRVCGPDDPLALWADLAGRIEDGADNANNRFAVAAGLNRLFPGIGPFWGCPPKAETPDLPQKGRARHGHGLPERRRVEEILPGTQPCWKLYTTGSVGSQALLGIPHLQALRQGLPVAVAPFQPPDAPIVLAEVFPSLIAEAIEARRARHEIKDRAQVRVMAQALRALPPERLAAMLAEGDPIEGWILGAGHQKEISAACP